MFLFEKEMMRRMSKFLDEEKEKILHDLSCIDKETLARIRELMADYYNAKSALDDKIIAVDTVIESKKGEYGVKLDALNVEYEKKFTKILNDYITKEYTEGVVAKAVSDYVESNNGGSVSVEMLNDALSHTLYQRYTATSEQSMDDLVQFGIHGWTYSTRPYDCPVADVGIVVVYQWTRTNDPSYGRMAQVLYSPSGIYTRYRSTTEWTEWYSSTGASGEVQRYNATSDKSMDELTNAGIYGWVYSTRPYDCPVEDAGFMVVTQFATTNNPDHGRLAQVVYTTYGTFTRYRTTTGWSEWQCGSTLNTADSVKINASCKKCNVGFTPSSDLDTSSVSIPTFVAGTSYKGIPYSARHYDSLDVLYNMNLDSLFSMLNNPATAIYHYTKNGAVGDVFTGAVCSSFVSWICNLPIYYTTYDIIKMLNYKTINDVEDIEIGDVLICHTTWGDNDDHAMIVSNIIVDGGGVTAVEIAEMWNPLFRKLLYTKDRFMGLLNGTTRNGQSYRVGRFDNHSIRTIKPLEINSVLMTETGNKVYRELGEDIFITTPANKKLTLSNNGAQSREYDISALPTKNNGQLCNIKNLVNAVGEWKITNPSETSEVCTVKVIKKGSATLAKGTKDTVTVGGYNGCTPCGYAVVGIRKGGDGNYTPYLTGCTASRLTIESKSNPKYAGTFTGKTINIDASSIGAPYVGYNVRVFYDTGYGQAYQDTNVVTFEVIEEDETPDYKSVTYRLTNVTASDEGGEDCVYLMDPYYTTLTATNGNPITVSIVEDGVDITDNTENVFISEIDGSLEISIPAVRGDIVITATA